MSDAEDLIGYYLGDPVVVVEPDDGWLRGYFASDRKKKLWRFWHDQVMTEPWGSAPVGLGHTVQP